MPTVENDCNFAKIYENHCKSPQVTARSKKCLLRTTSHWVNYTYIAGYADNRPYFLDMGIPLNQGIGGSLVQGHLCPFAAKRY